MHSFLQLRATANNLFILCNEKTKEQSKITSKPEDEAGIQEPCLLMIQ